MAKKQTAGFTVIEILIGLVVFAITIPTIAAGVNNLIVLNDRARDLTVANLIAESKAEELRSKGFNALTLGVTDMTSELPYELANPNSAYYEITNPSPGIAAIEIFITYDDYGGSPRVLKYKTNVSELGVGQ